jgi:O-antigen/teichoic acid export membrane protein
MLVQDVVVVFAPTSSKLDALGQRSELQVLFLRTTKYAAGASWIGCAGIAILAPLLLYVWVGEAFLGVAAVLTLLAAGRILFFVQLSSWYVLVGMAKQRVPAVIALVFVGVMGVGQWLVLGNTDWGLVGVAAVTTVVLVVGWGVVIPSYACRQLDVRLRQYYAAALIRPALACLPAALVWLALRQAPLNHAWVTLGVAALSGLVCCAIGWWFILFDDWDRRLVWEKIAAVGGKIRSLRAGRGAETTPTPPPESWPR